MNVFGHDVQARYWGSVENRCENVESMMLGVLAVAAVGTVFAVTVFASPPLLLVGFMVLAANVVVIARADRRREAARFLCCMHEDLISLEVAS